MKLTKEQKQALIDQLSLPWGRVKLRCDGYEIVLCVQPVKPLEYRVYTFVNGIWEGKWMSGRESYPEQKFLNKKETHCAKPSDKARAEKIFGKRAVAKDPWYTKKIVTYDVTWASGRQAINHLFRVCDSIEVIKEGGL